MDPLTCVQRAELLGMPLPAGWHNLPFEEQRQRADELLREVDDDSPIWKQLRIAKADLFPPPIQWAVGVTTAPREEPTLSRCLRSLRAAGWYEVHVFSDGLTQQLVDTATIRIPAVGAWPNWILTLSELVQREIDATHFMIVQDDAIFCRNTREYVEQILPDHRGVLSLYRSARHPGRLTYEHADGRRFIGAVALVIQRSVAHRMVSSDVAIAHRKRRNRGTDYIDGAVGQWCKDNRTPLWIHGPSLVQHIGTTSTIGHTEAPASTFPGEQFDACDLLRATTPAAPASSGDGIGICGFNTAQGLGYMNRDLATHLPVERWMVTEHSRFPNLDPVPGVGMETVRPDASDQTIASWLEGLRTVVFAETAIVGNLPRIARDMGVKTVCIPMFEWLPRDEGWLWHVDLWLAPTQHTYCQLVAREMPGRVAHCPWPIDVERFAFRERTKVETFAFAYGNGGPYDRKGGLIVAEAARLAPEVPLIVYSQTATHRSTATCDVDWPTHVEFRGAAEDPTELYRDGDVWLAPSRWEGLGLQLLECQSAGMPLICTDAPPMNEAHPWRRLPASPETVELVHPITSYVVSPQTLADTMRRCLGADIRDASVRARIFAQSRSWHRWAPAILDLVKD